MPSLSIIIVNYKASQLIIECLESIYQHRKSLSFEVIIVDNYSGSNDKEIIQERFPDTLWIQMNYNAGFARANNEGIRKATADIVLLLNPDTLAVDDSLDRCVEMFRRSSCIACGVQLLNADGSTQISGNFFMKGGINHLLPLPYWGDFLRWIAFGLKTRVPNIAKAKAVEEVDWINGAFLMVKKEAIGKAGLMDEDFFLYAEEIEWCSRLRKTGTLCIFGELHFIHLQGETVNKDQNSTEKGYRGLFDRKGLQVMLSNHVRVRKQYGAGWFLFLLLNYTWAIPLYGIASFIHRLFMARNPFAEWPKVASFAKNVFMVWKLAPVILRNKPYFYKVF